MDITLKNQKIWSPGDLQFNSAWFWTLLSTCGGLIRIFQKKKTAWDRVCTLAPFKSGYNQNPLKTPLGRIERAGKVPGALYRRFYAKSGLKALCRRSGMAVKAKRRIHCGIGLLKVSSEAILQVLGRLSLRKHMKRGGK